MSLYQFRDTIDHKVYDISLPTEAINYDGVFLENKIKGFRTLSVTGRELMGSIPTVDTIGTRNGGRFRNSRLGVREIEVLYSLLCDTSEEYRQAFNQLNYFLTSPREQEVQAWFNDEPDKYFKVTRSDVSSIEGGTNNITGSFTLVCADPYKYSRIEKVVDIDNQLLKIKNDPYYDTFENQCNYLFNPSCMPLNHIKLSEYLESVGGVVEYDITTPTQGTYVLEFDVGFMSNPSVFVEVGYYEGATQKTLQSVDMLTPNTQKVQLTVTLPNNVTKMFIKAEKTSSVFHVKHFSLTKNARQFWYPNPSDNTETLIEFSDEMYQLLRYDVTYLKLGGGTEKPIIKYEVNAVYVLGGVFPDVFNPLTEQARVQLVRDNFTRYTLEGEIRGVVKVNNEVKDFTPYLLKQSFVVGNTTLLDDSGVVRVELTFDSDVDFKQLYLILEGVAPSTIKTIVIDNQGTVPTPIDFSVTHNSSNGYLSFESSENEQAILVGNPSEVEGVNYQQNERLFFDSFETGKENANGWTYNNAVTLTGGKKGALPIENYNTSFTGNLVYDSNNFSAYKDYGVGGSVVTITPNQSLTVDTTTVANATRLGTSGGNNVNKIQVPKLDKLIGRAKTPYSLSLMVRNDGTTNVTITILNKTVTILPSESKLCKFENINNNTRWHLQPTFTVPTVADNLNVVVGRLMMNHGTTTKAWVSNYQDGVISTQSTFNHDYLPMQFGKMKFQSDKVLWGKKRSVVWVDDIYKVPTAKGAWTGAGMRKLIPSDSNGSTQLMNFNARAYLGIYQHEVKRRGVFQFTIDDDTSKVPLYSIQFWKGKARDTFEVGFFVRGKRVKSFETSTLNYFTGETRIIREGKKVTFIVTKSEKFGPSNTNNVTVQYSYTDNENYNVSARALNVYIARDGDTSKEVVNIFCHEVQITKMNVDKYVDTPNVFEIGDTCDILTDDYLVQTHLNYSQRLDIQDVGSKPIIAPVGISQVYVDYSDFAQDVSIKARYRERFV